MAGLLAVVEDVVEAGADAVAGVDEAASRMEATVTGAAALVAALAAAVLAVAVAEAWVWGWACAAVAEFALAAVGLAGAAEAVSVASPWSITPDSVWSKALLPLDPWALDPWALDPWAPELCAAEPCTEASADRPWAPPEAGAGALIWAMTAAADMKRVRT